MYVCIQYSQLSLEGLSLTAGNVGDTSLAGPPEDATDIDMERLKAEAIEVHILMSLSIITHCCIHDNTSQ